MTRATYGVAEQESRQSMQVNIIRAIATAFVGLIFLGVWGLAPFSGEAEPIIDPGIPVPTPTTSSGATTTAVATESPSPTPTDLPTQAPTDTPTQSTATPTPTVLPTDTPLSELTGTITIPAGVWLRSAPGLDSEQVEWLLDQTQVIILSGRESADDLDWQQIRTLEGQDGWVWADTVTINNE